MSSLSLHSALQPHSDQQELAAQLVQEGAGNVEVPVAEEKGGLEQLQLLSQAGPGPGCSQPCHCGCDRFTLHSEQLWSCQTEVTKTYLLNPDSALGQRDPQECTALRARFADLHCSASISIRCLPPSQTETPRGHHCALLLLVVNIRPCLPAATTATPRESAELVGFVFINSLLTHLGATFILESQECVPRPSVCVSIETSNSLRAYSRNTRTWGAHSQPIHRDPIYLPGSFM